MEIKTELLFKGSSHLLLATAYLDKFLEIGGVCTPGLARFTIGSLKELHKELDTHLKILLEKEYEKRL